MKTRVCLKYFVSYCSLFYNTSARHEEYEYECDSTDTRATRATRVLHERHVCDTSEKF